MLTVDEVTARANDIQSQQAPTKAQLDALCETEVAIAIDGLNAGYGQLQILFDLDLRVGKGESLCLIGPNGAGKSTVLHSIFGFTKVYNGTINTRAAASGDFINTSKLSPSQKLSSAGIAYIMQDSSIFPDMTVEENLLMGGFLLPKQDQAKQAAEAIFERYKQLAARRSQPARVLSGGERRLLEISRALVMDPAVLLVDEPSIGLEPRYIDMVFEILKDIRDIDKRTILMVEQNARKGLAFADIGYVLVSGKIALAAKGAELADMPEVKELFLGG
ncbi:MAG: ABC transporter ATP-binding protein [Alphaproteobacteria bacterium]|nr:ABC transporter ATP-binding protein [Alphaproteobacteria bacterium]